MGNEEIMRERWPTLSGAILVTMQIFLANVPSSR